jgi:hypothetical protein
MSNGRRYIWGGFMERGNIRGGPVVLPPAGAGRGVLCSAAGYPLPLPLPCSAAALAALLCSAPAPVSLS